MKVIFIIWLAFTIATFLFAILGSIIAVQRYEKSIPMKKSLTRPLLKE